jgi:hypothetical protein
VAGFRTAHDSNLTPRYAKTVCDEFRKGGIGSSFHWPRRDTDLQGIAMFPGQFAVRSPRLDVHGDLDAAVQRP